MVLREWYRDRQAKKVKAAFKAGYEARVKEAQEPQTATKQAASKQGYNGKDENYLTPPTTSLSPHPYPTPRPAPAPSAGCSTRLRTPTAP